MNKYENLTHYEAVELLRYYVNNIATDKISELKKENIKMLADCLQTQTEIKEVA